MRRVNPFFLSFRKRYDTQRLWTKRRELLPTAHASVVRLGETCRAQLDGVFDGFDVLLTPCTNGEAPVGLGHTGDPGFQAIWTILHVPAMSLPTHRGPTGLPVGIQLIAPKYKDEQLFACARWIWQRLRPA